MSNGNKSVKNPFFITCNIWYVRNTTWNIFRILVENFRKNSPKIVKQCCEHTND